MKPRKIVRKDRVKWEARWWDGSQKKVKGKTFDTKKQAEDFMATVKVAQRKGTYIDPARGKIKLCNWWEEYQQTPAWVNLKPSSRDSYRNRFTRYALPHFGNTSLTAIKRLDVARWIADLQRQGVSPANIDKAHMVLGRLLQEAQNLDLIPSNPAKGLKTPKAASREMGFLTPDQVERIADAVPPRYKALILTLAWTGLRIGEATALRIQNLNLLKGRLEVVEAFAIGEGKLNLGETKTGTKRSVTLPGFLKQVLADHLEAYPPGESGLVFTTAEGHPINRNNFRTRVWLPALKKAGVPPLRVHDLRHTAVSFAIFTGAHPKEIQARAGHSSIAVTMDRYGHLFAGQDEALADRLDALRANPHLVQTWFKDDSKVVPIKEQNA